MDSAMVRKLIEWAVNNSIVVVVFALAWGSASRSRALVSCLLGMVPGILLLLVAQYAATGDAPASTERAYYAASDGPRASRLGRRCGLADPARADAVGLCAAAHGEQLHAQTGEDIAGAAHLDALHDRQRAAGPPGHSSDA